MKGITAQLYFFVVAKIEVFWTGFHRKEVNYIYITENIAFLEKTPIAHQNHNLFSRYDRHQKDSFGNVLTPSVLLADLLC